MKNKKYIDKLQIQQEYEKLYNYIKMEPSKTVHTRKHTNVRKKFYQESSR